MNIQNYLILFGKNYAKKKYQPSIYNYRNLINKWWSNKKSILRYLCFIKQCILETEYITIPIIISWILIIFMKNHPVYNYGFGLY